jgi:hypothetical protein
MAGNVAVFAAALAAVVAMSGVAAAATRDAALDPGKLTLQAADFPGSHSSGSKLSGQGPLVAGYERTIKLAKPYGASHLVAIVSFSFVARDVQSGTLLYHVLGREFSQKQGRLALVKQFLTGAGLKVKPSAVTMVKPRGLGVKDSSMAIGFVVKALKTKLNLAVTLVRLDRVIDVTVATGIGHAAAPGDELALTKLAAGHIAAALVPISATPPTITGTAAQGQTLTATNGTWSNTPTAYAVQWQRCDTAGANCADIAAATSSTYAVTSADAGTTLRATVTASNRFGSASATSAQTAAVT